MRAPFDAERPNLITHCTLRRAVCQSFLFPLVRPTLQTSGIFHDSRVHF